MSGSLRRGWLGLALAATAASCLPAPVALRPPGSADTALAGRVDFGLPPGSATARQVQAALGEIANGATVSLIDAATGVTASTAKTSPDGGFLLRFPSSFAPGAGPFYLEAIKGLSDMGSGPNRVGAAAARLRTLVSFNGNWTSLSAAGITLNRSTTALSAIANLKGLSGAATLTLMGSLNLGVADSSLAPSTTDTFTPGSSGISNAEFHRVWGLTDDLLARDLDPLANLSLTAGTFTNAGNQTWMMRSFRPGSKNNVAIAEAGYAQLGYAVPPAPVPGSANEEAYFQAQGTAPNGMCIMDTDGTFLYGKSFPGWGATDGNAYIYKKIGTGFGGSVRGQNYGSVGAVTQTAISTVYWAGALWFPSNVSANNQLQRLDVGSGQVSTVTTTDPLLTRQNGTTSGGSYAQIASDGTYVYSFAYQHDGGSFNGYKVRVVDPAQNFAVVRDLFTDPVPASYYCEGFWSDGIYMFAYAGVGGTDPVHRMARFRLSDGQLEASWTHPIFNSWSSSFNTAANDPDTGTYDPTNNRFWIADLTGDHIHQIKGGTFQASGTYTSPVFDAGQGARFRSLAWGATTPAGTGLTFRARAGDSPAGIAGTAWYGPTGTGDSYTGSGQALNTILSGHRYVQVEATLSTTDTMQTPRLRWFSLVYQ